MSLVLPPLESYEAQLVAKTKGILSARKQIFLSKPVDMNMTERFLLKTASFLGFQG